MSRRTKQIEIQGQEAFMGMEDLDPSLQPDKPGISVNLKTRAYHLGSTLDILGRLHQLEGLDTASDPILDSPNRTRLLERYGAGLDQIRQDAADKRTRLENDAKWQFAYATGWMAVKGCGITTDAEILQLTREDFIQFDAMHFGSKEATNTRARLKRTLQKHRK